jgi:hypothetical protein
MAIFKAVALAAALTIGAISFAAAQNGPATGNNTPAAGGAGNASTGSASKSGAGAGDSAAMNKPMSKKKHKKMN